ncbi:hypothetical protein E4P24_02800 [Haloferax sp. AS1]|uniref:hypothetical protein n=1 Tax=Haloferax sp. AS1 TaxID=2562277 RepID=UPI00165ECB27|nr:hypothetical protein [Haloferax sp. AS1]MBC9985300.1 hypothetical protein [Haloferax sp. AS1]
MIRSVSTAEKGEVGQISLKQTIPSYNLTDWGEKLRVRMDIPPGPSKLRYFTILLVATALLLAFGAVLSEAYGFTLLEDVMIYFANHTLLLFELAGVISLTGFLIKVHQRIN